MIHAQQNDRYWHFNKLPAEIVNYTSRCGKAFNVIANERLANVKNLIDY